MIEFPLFPIAFLASVVIHGAVFLWFCVLYTIPPVLIPSRQGVVSIKLVASEALRPQTTPEELMSEIPPLEEPIKEPPLPAPAVEVKDNPLDRPRVPEPLPELTTETKMTTPVEVPDLPSDLLPRLTTSLNTVAPTVPQPQVLQRTRE